MAEVFTTSGESSDNVAVPSPILQGFLLPSIDNSQAVDGFGVVIPWGGGSTTRKYSDYGISAEVSRQSTQLNDLATGFIPGGGATYNLEGLVGPQGAPGKDGTILIIHQGVGINSSYLTALPHNLDLINDLGTAVDKFIYTDAYTTYSETVWTERTPIANADNSWQSLASDSDGSNLIAGLYIGRLFTSANAGVSWTERQPAGASDKYWGSVASDDDGSNLIAGVYLGRLYTSANSGVNWTERQPAGAADKYWRAIASDSDGSHLIAGAYPGRLFTSADSGVSWTERQPAGAADANWRSAASDSDGTNLIVVDDYGRLYTSANSGVNWTERQPAGAADQRWQSVASDSDGTNLIACYLGAGGVYTSTDSGATWIEESPGGSLNQNCRGVASDSDGSNLMVGLYGGNIFTGVISTLYSEATWAESSLTSAGRAILDDANAAAQAVTLGLEIGVDTQAWDAQLDDIAALAVTNGNFMVGDGSNWVVENGDTARVSLGVGTTDSPTFAGYVIKDVVETVVLYSDENEFYITEYSAVTPGVGNPIGLALVLTYAS